MSGHIFHLAILHSPVFLLNSRLSHFSAAHLRERPFSRSYGAILPSSLTANLPCALVRYTQPPVSVYGTGAYNVCLAVFLGSMITNYWFFRRVLSPQSRLSLRICLQTSISTSLNRDIRHPAVVSLLRLHIAIIASTGILTRSSIVIALRLRLRSRLTLIRRALIRNPWSFGGEESHLPYRYSFLHLLFPALQQISRFIFFAQGMLPYHPYGSMASAGDFMPDYYPRLVARLVSCYALLGWMAASKPTSQLSLRQDFVSPT